MINRKNNSWLTKLAVVGIFPLAALSLTGCDTSGPEEGADVEDIVEENESVDDGVVEDDAIEDDVVGGPFVYDGIYDQTFYDDYENYVGEEVTVSADVNEIVSPESFTISGTASTTVDALLIVGATADVEEGEAVQVTGIVRQAFDLPTVEEDMGLDLEDELFGDFEAQNYIEASSVEKLENE